MMNITLDILPEVLQLGISGDTSSHGNIEVTVEIDAQQARQLARALDDAADRLGPRLKAVKEP